DNDRRSRLAGLLFDIGQLTPIRKNPLMHSPPGGGHIHPATQRIKRHIRVLMIRQKMTRLQNREVIKLGATKPDIIHLSWCPPRILQSVRQGLVSGPRIKREIREHMPSQFHLRFIRDNRGFTIPTMTLHTRDDKTPILED